MCNASTSIWVCAEPLFIDSWKVTSGTFAKEGNTIGRVAGSVETEMAADDERSRSVCVGQRGNQK